MVEQEKIHIEHAEEDGRGAFFIAKQGVRLAEMTYSRTGEKLVIVDHTEVDDRLRGLGVGRKLLDAVVAWVLLACLPNPAIEVPHMGRCR